MSYFALKNSFCNIHLFLKILFRRKSTKLLKLEVPLFCHFYKSRTSRIQFQCLFCQFYNYYLYIENFIFCLTLVTINMPSQKRKKRRNRNCYIVCQLKPFLTEMNQLLVPIRLPAHLICKMTYRFHLKLSNLRKYPTTITMITYQMKIIESA